MTFQAITMSDITMCRSWNLDTFPTCSKTCHCTAGGAPAGGGSRLSGRSLTTGLMIGNSATESVSSSESFNFDTQPQFGVINSSLTHSDPWVFKPLRASPARSLSSFSSMKASTSLASLSRWKVDATRSPPVSWLAGQCPIPPDPPAMAHPCWAPRTLEPRCLLCAPPVPPSGCGPRSPHWDLGRWPSFPVPTRCVAPVQAPRVEDPPWWWVLSVRSPAEMKMIPLSSSSDISDYNKAI